MIRIKKKNRRLAAVLFSTSLFLYIWIYYLPSDSGANINISLHRRMANQSGVRRAWSVSEISEVQNLEKGWRYEPVAERLPTTTTRETLNISIRVSSDQPLLNLFTTWEEESDRYPVHNFTVRNWQSLRPYVIPVVFTNQATVADDCRRKGWDVLPVRISANGGIPVLKLVFLDAISTYNTTFYGYGNSDILFTDSLIKTLAGLKMSLKLDKPILIIEKRTNVNYVGEKGNSDVEKIKCRGKFQTQIIPRTGRGLLHYITILPMEEYTGSSNRAAGI